MVVIIVRCHSYRWTPKLTTTGRDLDILKDLLTKNGKVSICTLFKLMSVYTFF